MNGATRADDAGPIRCYPSTATWRSGYAAACKAVYTGSIPVVASRGRKAGGGELVSTPRFRPAVGGRQRTRVPAQLDFENCPLRERDYPTVTVHELLTVTPDKLHASALQELS
jgi:hypothetical protein